MVICMTCKSRFLIDGPLRGNIHKDVLSENLVSKLCGYEDDVRHRDMD